MRKDMKRIALAVGVACALVLTACGGGSSTETKDSSGAKKMGGTLTIASVADAQPGKVLAQRNGNNPWVQQVFQYLTRNDPKTMEPKGYLAVSWDVSEDKKVYEVKIRDDAKFHDGRQLTAEDVVWSYEAVKDPANASQLRFIAEAMTKIEAVDDYTVRFTLDSPQAGIFDLFNLTPIVDKNTFADYSSGKKVIGSGPFKFESWDPGSKMVLKKFTDYAESSKVAFDEIDIIIMADSTAQISAMRSNRAQLTWGMGSNDIRGFEKDKNFDIDEINHVVYAVGFDTTSPVMQKKEVRQAIGYAIDSKRVVDQVFSGAAIPTNLYWDPRDPTYDKTQADHFKFDANKAAQMIEKAGVKGKSIKIAVQGIPINQAALEVIRNNVEAAGMKAEIVTYPPQQFNEMQVAGDLKADMFLVHYGGGWSPATHVFAQATLKQQNLEKWTDGQWETLKSELAASEDDNRSESVKKLTDYMLDEAFTFAICQSNAEVLRSAKLQGSWYAPGGGLVLSEAYMG